VSNTMSDATIQSTDRPDLSGGGVPIHFEDDCNKQKHL